MAYKHKHKLLFLQILVLSFFGIVIIRDIIPTTTFIPFDSTEHHQNGTLYNYTLAKDESDQYLWFYPTLTINIGVQKAGTTSVQKKLQFTHHNHIYATKGIHYLCPRSPDYKTNNLSISEYIERILQLSSSSQHQSPNHKHYYFTKTPSFSIYAHVARLITGAMVPYGTKILIFLRHPRKRFISGYFEAHSQNKYEINEVIDAIFNYDTTVHGDNSLTAFNSYLDTLYDEYVTNGGGDTKNFVQIVDRFEQLIYYYENLNHMDGKALIWLRSCYPPQVLTWLYYMDSLGTEYKHLFKIVQSEQLFDQNTFG
eukprot:509674_1